MPGGATKHHLFVIREWNAVVTKTLEHAFGDEGIRYVSIEPILLVSSDSTCKRADSETQLSQKSQALAEQLSHTALSTAAMLALYAMQLCAFPWKFSILLVCDPEVEAAILSEACREWTFVLESEATSSKWPSQVPLTRWQAYREIMTVGHPGCLACRCALRGAILFCC
jgi:hypothetical protein